MDFLETHGALRMISMLENEDVDQIIIEVRPKQSSKRIVDPNEHKPSSYFTVHRDDPHYEAFKSAIIEFSGNVALVAKNAIKEYLAEENEE